MSSPSTGASSLQPNSPCPCGSGQTFTACCEPVLRQQRPAATAEELMRSRFTAHAIRDYAHLHRTFLGTARLPYRSESDDDDGDLAWTRLVVHSHETTAAKPDSAFVDFSAFYQDDGVERAIHEKSEFQRLDGEWFYTRAVRSGPAPIKATHPKIGRNDPCPCGSGKKYKQCCLARA